MKKEDTDRIQVIVAGAVKKVGKDGIGILMADVFILFSLRMSKVVWKGQDK